MKIQLKLLKFITPSILGLLTQTNAQNDLEETSYPMKVKSQFSNHGNPLKNDLEPPKWVALKNEGHQHPRKCPS